MQVALSQPLRPQDMPFSDFLAALFQALESEGVRPCILRNYEGFPAKNAGGDVDFLIDPAELPRVLRAVHSIPGIRIVGYTHRAYVAGVFLEGTHSADGSRSLQLDFLWSLSFKEMPYLPTDTVLKAAIPRQAGNLNFFVPIPVHEAIASLLTSLIIGGTAKEKYIPKVQQTFAGKRSETIAALLPQFGLKASTRLVDAVISGDRQKINGCSTSIRIALTLRSLLYRPIRSVIAIARHYLREIDVRFSPKSLEAVCILGPDNVRTAVTDKLMPMLLYSSKEVVRRYFRPQSFFARESRSTAPSAGSPVLTPRGSIASMTMVALWLLDEWLNQFIGKKNDTLRIFDSYCHDLLIDPRRFRYGGPRWFARLIGRLAPSPHLWILLDPCVDGALAENRKQIPAETLRQLEASRAFVRTNEKYIILDASRPIDEITNSAHAAIIDTLTQLTYSRKLKSRLSCTRPNHPAANAAARSSR